VVTGDTLVTARATNYFTPHKFVGGLAVDALPNLTIGGELTWSNWAAYPSGVADIRALVALDITPPLVQTDVPPAEFTNTLGGRLGAEYVLGGKRTHYALRGGYAYIPSPVPEQTGLTSFADNDRHVVSLGFGIDLADWKPILTRPIELSVALQWHHLQSKLTVKDASQFPGEAFSSGGDIFHLGSSMTVNF
jgi:long-subunit fatty acid transport protein